MTGEEAPDQIDHINGDCSNNGWSNLRDGSGFTNALNQRMHSNNVSGVSGVWWDNNAQKWHVRPWYKGQGHYLGLFENLDEALMEVLEFRADREEYTNRHGQKEKEGNE